MAYILKSRICKNEDVTYTIFNTNRIPGTKNSYKSTVVKKFSKDALAKDGIENPEEYVKEYLEELKKQLEEKKEEEIALLNIPLNAPLREKDDKFVNLGYAVYSSIYHNLELDKLINMRRQHTKAEYNANQILQHLVYSRCLDPASKISTWRDRGRFYDQITDSTGEKPKDYQKDSVYYCMDDILSWRKDILNQMNNMIKKKYGRKNTILYYDVTNYYFERDIEDDEDGLRARGPCKEHRPEPIIQMGLFMDEIQIPITYGLYRGNTADSLTFKDALDDSVIDFTDKRKIFVADKGMLSYHNILKIRNDKNGYVMSQSIRKSDADTVKFALDESGYTYKIDEETGEIIYKIKERTTLRTAKSYGEVDDKQHTGHYNERQIFIWSKKYDDRAKESRKKTIEDAKEYAGTKSKNNKDSNYGKLKYVKKKAIKDGEAVDADYNEVVLDEEAIKEDEKYDGYYIIVTNVVGLEEGEEPNPDYPADHAYYRNDGFLVFNKKVSSEDIRSIYGGLEKIEETFKVTKTGMLNLRPVFHSLQDRIRAHFLICFIALVIERLLERKLNWKYSSSTIQKSLNSFNALNIYKSNIWQVTGENKVALEAYRKLGIEIPGRNIRQERLRSIFSSTKKIKE